MSARVQFVSDAAGQPTAVLVPIREWERIQQRLAAEKAKAPKVSGSQAPRRSKKEQFKEDFRAAVREMQAGKGRPAREFLAELDALSSQNH